MSAGKRRGRRGWLAAGVTLGVLGGALLALAALGVGGTTAGPAAPGLKPEYERVVALPGTVSREIVNGVARLVFRSQDKKWSAVLLENQIVSALEDEIARHERQPLVSITGVVSDYRGRNYLLLTGAQITRAVAE